MRSLAVYILLCLFCLSAGLLAQTKAEKNFKKLAADILENLQEYWPVHATEMGVHKYDDHFTDYSSKAVNKERKALREYLARLLKYKGVRLPEDMKIDLKLLTSNCQIANLKLWEKKLYTKNPNIYLSDAADGLYFIMIRAYDSPEEQLNYIIGRMNALPAFLQQGEVNLLEPPPIWLEHARGNAANVIDLYRSISEEMQSRFPDRSDEIVDASTRAINALNQFKNFLNRLQPGEPGSFAIGKIYFDYILAHQYFFDFDADSLLKIGEELLSDAQYAFKAAKHDLAEKGLLDTLPVYVPTSLTKKDVMGYYSWEINAVRQFIIDKGILSIPDDIGACQIKETPKYLQGIISDIAYQPAGPFDKGKTGYFYVCPIEDELSDDRREKFYRDIHTRAFRGAVVHEAYPGHHLQLQLAGRHPSNVRRWQMNNSFIEGWALYCEHMMHTIGLYDDDPSRYLRVLRGIAFRAARIVVDVKLHTGQFDYSQAVSWMSEEMDIDTAYIKTEVYRYTTDPGQPMSYLMGKLQIENLEAEVASRRGDVFSFREFHDKLLSEGSIPVSLIADKMLR